MHNCNPLCWCLRCTRVGRQWFSFHQYRFARTPICGLTLQHFQPISTNCLPSASCNLVTSMVFPVAIVSPLTVYISTCLWISGDVKSALWTVLTLGRQQLVVSGSCVNRETRFRIWNGVREENDEYLTWQWVISNSKNVQTYLFTHPISRTRWWEGKSGEGREVEKLVKICS